MIEDTFSNRLKILRQEADLTQKQLASALSISVSTLSHWECGYQEPSSKDIVRLAVIFDVSTDYLLGLENFGGIVIGNRNLPLTNEETEILEIYQTLTYAQKEDVKSYLHILAKLNAGSDSDNPKKKA